MGVFNVNGSPVIPFANTGIAVNAAYNVSGNQVFPDPLSLRVMSYNVGGWYIGSGRNVPAAQEAEYYALQTGMIRAAHPDVLVIQEYLSQFSDSGTSALTILQSLFPYVHVKPSGTWYGRAICSKYPISNYVERQFTQEPSRYFDSCTITKRGVEISIINTHLGLTQANRTPEIQQLIAYLSTLNTFVACGDYNTGITDADLTTGSAAYINNVKPFLDAGFQTANFGRFGFLLTCVDRATNTNYYLDNEYLSSNIQINNVTVDTTKLTDGIDDPIDHMPLIVDMTI